MSTGAIEKEALALPLEDRARLTEKLLKSLDTETSSPPSQAWEQQIECRLEEVKQGKVKPAAGEEVSRKAWELVKPAAP